MDITARCPYHCQPCNGTCVSAIWPAAPHGDFSYNRPPVCACRARVAREIAACGTGDCRCSLDTARVELCRLLNFRAQSRHRDLATNAATPTLRLGNGRRHRSDVDGKSALVRGGVFLGDWRHAGGRAYAQLALWFSRLAVHQLFYVALRYYHRRGFPDADAAIPPIPLVDRARVSVVGV